MGYQRDEIESFIKEKNIDRTKFFEVSKHSYEQIIKKIESAFVDNTKNWNAGIHWANMGYYRPELKCVSTAVADDSWILGLSEVIGNSELVVYVLFEDTKAYAAKYWLYEAYLDELIVVLHECPLWGDFYIVSKKFDWLISLNHHDIVSYVGNSANWHFKI